MRIIEGFMRKVLWSKASVISSFLMVFVFTFAPIRAQAYFGLPYSGFPYSGFSYGGFPYSGFPYDSFPYSGYNLAYNSAGYPYYSTGIGSPSYNGTLAYNGIFGLPYVTAPPPDFSGWTWTSPTQAYSPPLPDGTSAAVSVDWAAGQEGMSPYYQQNYTPSSPYQQDYTSVFPPYDGASLVLQLSAALGVPPFLFPAVLGSDGVDYTPSFLYQALTNPVPPGCYGKPAIYLYPQTDTSVSVKLDIDGEITKTIPPYNNGWHVLAKADGTITDESQGEQGKHYDYLFWEAKPKKLELPDKGWIVARKDLEEWFNEYLPKLGLNKKEKEQFMEYWLERLQGKNYYELKLLDRAFLEEHAKLTITPSPDTLIRVIFCFTPLDEYKPDEYKPDGHKTDADGYKALEPPLIETPERKGFVSLEWGGILSEGK
jgi:hypothetical protein